MKLKKSEIIQLANVFCETYKNEMYFVKEYNAWCVYERWNKEWKYNNDGAIIRKVIQFALKSKPLADNLLGCYKNMRSLIIQASKNETIIRSIESLTEREDKAIRSRVKHWRLAKLKRESKLKNNTNENKIQNRCDKN